MLYRLLVILLIGCGFFDNSNAQIVKKKYKWKHIHQKTTPESTGDSGSYTATGMGWIECGLFQDKYWFAGSITGGLYRSKNQGRSWSKIDQDTLQMGTLDLEVIGDTIYRATGITHFDEKFGLGLFKSSNRGNSWQSTGLLFKPVEGQPLWVIKKSKNNKVLIACSQDRIYHSEDYARKFKEVFNQSKADFRQVVASKHTDELMFACGTILLKSTNNGANWFDITKRLSVYSLPKTKKFVLSRVAVCEDPNQASRFLAQYMFKNQLFIDESLDNGETWHSMQRSYKVRRIDIHHNEIQIAPGNSNVVVIGGVYAYKSIDNCASFTKISKPIYQGKQYAHDDIRGLAVYSDLHYRMVTDGGVMETFDGGEEWINHSGKGLIVSQIYGLELLSKDSILYGCQDMGTFLYTKKKTQNIERLYGDGGDALNIRGNPAVMVNGAVYRINLNSFRAKYFAAPSGQRPFDARLYRHPNSQDSFYYQADHMWLHTGIKWEILTKSIPNNNFRVTGFAVDPNHGKEMYFAFNQPTWAGSPTKKFYKSVNGGKNWTDITPNLPILSWFHVTSIAIDSVNPETVYVSLGIIDASDEIHKVYKSEDGGETWTNYSNGLPGLHTFKIESIKGTSGVLVSTMQGMYYRNASMQKWQKLSGKIPPVCTRDFEIDYNNRTLYVGTYGNGLWKMKMPKKMFVY